MLEKLIGDIIKGFSSFSNSSIPNILSIISLVGCVICYVAYKIIRNKHLADPDFVAKEKEREESYKQQLTAELKKQSGLDTMTEIEEHLKSFDDMDWNDED